MITLVKGDIFESQCDVITITVNCRGVMGKGIALMAKMKFPELFQNYRILCNHGKIKLGYPILHTISTGEKFLLFPTKDHWRYNSKLEWIESGLIELKRIIHQIDSLALAPLGCGNGKLNFDDVLDLIFKHLEDADCQINVYVPV